MAEQLRDFAQLNEHQGFSLALSKVNDILGDIKLRKPKQQTFKRRDSKDHVRSMSFSYDRL